MMTKHLNEIYHNNKILFQMAEIYELWTWISWEFWMNKPKKGLNSVGFEMRLNRFEIGIKLHCVYCFFYIKVIWAKIYAEKCREYCLNLECFYDFSSNNNKRNSIRIRFHFTFGHAFCYWILFFFLFLYWCGTHQKNLWYFMICYQNIYIETER